MKSSSWTKYINGFFWILFIAIALFFFIIQNTLYDPNSKRNYNVEPVTQEASVILENGEIIPVGIKNDCYDYESKPGETVSIIATLPEINENDLTVSLLSNEQTIRIYIDGKLRTEYTDEYYHILNNNSSGNIITTRITKEDSKKNIRIDYETTLTESAKILCCAFVCTEMDFFCWVLARAGIQLLSGVILLVLGFILLLVGLYFKVLRKNDRGIAPLGLYSLLVAAWLFFRCNLRGYYLKHIGSAETISYFVLMIAPIPILMFFNLLLKYQYEKIYSIATVILIANLATEGVLELLGVINVIEISGLTNFFIFTVCILCLVTISDYSKKNKLENGTFIVTGIIGFMISTVVENTARNYFKEQFVGRYVGTGMLFFLLMIAYSAIKNLAIQEQDLQDAIRQNEIKSDFLANMSHEIRTPINTIMGMDEMILRESEDSEIIHYATNISNATRNLLSLVDDILDYSRIEAGKMELVEKRYNLARVLLDVIDATGVRASKKGLDFKYEIDKDIPAFLLGDETRIRQVLNNILTNAVKYTREGEVELRVGFSDAQNERIKLTIEVKDTGIGIKDEDKSRLFESFVRLEESRNKSIEGTGLGMSITKQIVDMLGGSILLDSEYGKGSVFTISFEQKVMDATPIGDITRYSTNVSKKQEYNEEYVADNLSILVVDDNEMNTEVITGLLRNTNARIDTASSGFECLDIIDNNSYDLIFMDHMMPEMDGIETLTKIKLMDGRISTIPVIALTANAVVGAREEYIKYGFTDYLSKPVKYKDLIEIIHKYLPDKFKYSGTKKSKKEVSYEYLENNGILACEALKYVEDNSKQYNKLLTMFVSQNAKQKKRQLHDFFIEEDWKNYIVAVHGLKNTARTIGANDLADMAYEHEMQAKEGNTGFVVDNFYQLDNKWAKVMEIIETYVKDNGIILSGTENSLEIKELTREQKKEYVEEIISLIDNFKRSEAVNLLDEIAEYRWDKYEKDKLLEAARLINSYEYELAIEMIKGIV